MLRVLHLCCKSVRGSRAVETLRDLTRELSCRRVLRVLRLFAKKRIAKCAAEVCFVLESCEFQTGRHRSVLCVLHWLEKLAFELGAAIIEHASCLPHAFETY